MSILPHDASDGDGLPGESPQVDAMDTTAAKPPLPGIADETERMLLGCYTLGDRVEVKKAIANLAELAIADPARLIAAIVERAAEYHEIDDDQLGAEIDGWLLAAARKYGTPAKPSAFAAKDDAFQPLTRVALGHRSESWLDFQEVAKDLVKNVQDSRTPAEFIMRLLGPSIKHLNLCPKSMRAWFVKVDFFHADDASPLASWNWRSQTEWEDLFRNQRPFFAGHTDGPDSVRNAAADVLMKIEGLDFCYPINTVVELLGPAATACGMTEESLKCAVEREAEKVNPHYKTGGESITDQLRSTARQIADGAVGSITDLNRRFGIDPTRLPVKLLTGILASDPRFSHIDQEHLSKVMRKAVEEASLDATSRALVESGRPAPTRPGVVKFDPEAKRAVGNGPRSSDRYSDMDDEISRLMGDD